jgi:hypothetical protein
MVNDNVLAALEVAPGVTCTNETAALAAGVATRIAKLNKNEIGAGRSRNLVINLTRGISLCRSDWIQFAKVSRHRFLREIK